MFVGIYSFICSFYDNRFDIIFSPNSHLYILVTSIFTRRDIFLKLKPSLKGIYMFIFLVLEHSRYLIFA